MKKEITQTADGVDIRLSGDIAKAKLEEMVSNCNSGDTCSCECNSDLKDHIKHVDVSGVDGDVTLSLKGDTLTANQVIEAMGECDMEKYL